MTKRNLNNFQLSQEFDDFKFELVDFDFDFDFDINIDISNFINFDTNENLNLNLNLNLNVINKFSHEISHENIQELRLEKEIIFSNNRCVLVVPDLIDCDYTETLLYQLMKNYNLNPNEFEGTKYEKLVKSVKINGKYYFYVPKKYVCNSTFLTKFNSDEFIESIEMNDSIISNSIKYIESLFFWNIDIFPLHYVKLIQKHYNLFAQFINCKIDNEPHLKVNVIMSEILTFILNFSISNYEFNSTIIKKFYKLDIFNSIGLNP
jgi:hypothetical protein